MTLTVRLIEPRDYKAVVALLQAFNVHEHKPPSNLTEHLLADWLAGPQRFVYGHVAERGNEIIGYTLFYKGINTDTGTSGFHIHDMYVKPAARNGAVAKQLATTLARFALDHSAQWLCWMVQPDNIKTLALYEAIAVRDEDLSFVQKRDRIAMMAGSQWRDLIRHRTPS